MGFQRTCYAAYGLLANLTIIVIRALTERTIIRLFLLLKLQPHASHYCMQSAEFILTQPNYCLNQPKYPKYSTLPVITYVISPVICNISPILQTHIWTKYFEICCGAVTTAVNATALAVVLSVYKSLRLLLLNNAFRNCDQNCCGWRRLPLFTVRLIEIFADLQRQGYIRRGKKKGGNEFDPLFQTTSAIYAQRLRIAHRRHNVNIHTHNFIHHKMVDKF